MEDRLTEQLKNRSVRPSTPGELVTDLLECNGLSITKAATRLGVSRVTLSRLINDQQSLSVDMAQRLGRFFGNGAALWLNLKQQVELWDLLHAEDEPYKSIEPLKLAA